MMTRRRSPLGVLFLVGMGVLIGAAVFGGTEAIAGVLATPFVILSFMFKVFLFVLLFGFIARAIGRGGPRSYEREEWAERRQEWCGGRVRHHRTGEHGSRPSSEDRFDEWHRMAHARQEVDEHTPPVET